MDDSKAWLLSERNQSEKAVQYNLYDILKRQTTERVNKSIGASQKFVNS